MYGTCYKPLEMVAMRSGIQIDLPCVAINWSGIPSWPWKQESKIDKTVK